MESIVIEQEMEFKGYLVGSRPRKLTEGTANSYIDYLNNVTNHLNIDITFNTINSEQAVSDIVEQLSDTTMPDGSRRNCQSALRAYLEFNNESFQIAEPVFPDELSTHTEGLVQKVVVNKYERDSTARTACIKHHGVKCLVCDFDFFKTYGNVGKGFIHVHHVTPISSIGSRYKVNPILDLIPVCPNCHAMLHAKNPPYTVSELKEKMLQV
ncbi:HNH endonuclease [Vibrio metschnikovii]|nr:HNH endonuclease [Vibrio metschnikovii]EKO3570344.1 HNH endonuclease [Vibrio metschnikovii]EKO3587358.1 HNH endonuclease [Vibrio metschnikovii]EKO3601312.1 HNH endonuclease [Vibrio metschnikovii]EKO3604883.1 HNH endonuclease [Vibrio metschnikovii]